MERRERASTVVKRGWRRKRRRGKEGRIVGWKRKEREREEKEEGRGRRRKECRWVSKEEREGRKVMENATKWKI